MKVRRMLAALLAFSFAVVSLAEARPGAAAGEDNFAKPVFQAAHPNQIKVTKEGGEIEIFLTGKDLAIGAENRWDARQILLYVRRSGTGEPWQGLYNNLRGDGYPNFPIENGHCAYDWNESIRVWLPKARWCSTEGQLEFIMVKGKWDGQTGDMLIQEKTRSAVFPVPVRTYLDGPVCYAKSLYPAYYVVNESNPSPLRVCGYYSPGSVVVVDGTDWPVTNDQAAPACLITAGVPAGFLSVPGQHKVTIRDPQGSPCVPATLWVYGPPKIKDVTPKGLFIGAPAATIVLAYEGLQIDKAEVRVGHIYEMGSQGNQPAGPATVKPVAGAGGTGSTLVGRKVTIPAGSTAPAASEGGPKQWTPVDSAVIGPDKVKITIPAEWLKQKGTVGLKITSKAGSAEMTVPIQKPPVSAVSKPTDKAVVRHILPNP
ncbi:MAG TPA: hypothetical protein P5119_09800 [Candidatus Aminicenantes bacterium]|nr:hypothetical protein [Candidatus Aminicenantes bacterium]HRY65617.1 hypothetical protein [Candidatus Aminicenantes bacterium]HRZ72495.1 hypothetical protein [Candidatus Aminicenantes bacterium]